MKHFIYISCINIWQFLPFKKELIKFLRFFNISFEKYIRDLWFEGKFKVNYFDSCFYLNAYKKDKGSLEIFYKGLEQSWDAQSIIIWGKLAKKANVIFDIGANIGLYAIAAKSVNPKSMVYAFEPSISALEILINNITTNGYDIQICDFALSNRAGIATFWDSIGSSAGAKLKDPVKGSSPSPDLTRKIQVQTLTEFVETNQIQNIDLISIDVEFHEPEVLEGMSTLIEKFSPDFIIEVLNNEAGEKIELFFKGGTYLFFAIDEYQRKLQQSQHLRRISETQHHSYNFLICKKETAEYLGLHVSSY